MGGVVTDWFTGSFAELEETHSVASSLEILPAPLRDADDDKMSMYPLVGALLIC